MSEFLKKVRAITADANENYAQFAVDIVTITNAIEEAASRGKYNVVIKGFSICDEVEKHFCSQGFFVNAALRFISWAPADVLDTKWKHLRSLVANVKGFEVVKIGNIGSFGENDFDLHFLDTLQRAGIFAFVEEDDLSCLDVKIICNAHLQSPNMDKYRVVAYEAGLLPLGLTPDRVIFTNTSKMWNIYPFNGIARSFCFSDARALIYRTDKKEIEKPTIYALPVLSNNRLPL